MGRPKIKPDISGWTKPSQFRLTAETLAEIDWLLRRWGVGSRADVVRQAVRRASAAEGYATAPPRPAPRRRRAEG